MNSKELVVSCSPHVRSKDNIRSVMTDVVIALIPAILASVYFFGVKAAAVIICCVISCVVTEAVCQKMMKRKITVNDMSAVVTGILLAFCLPPGTPLIIAFIGGIIAIGIGKMVFGGLGNNPFNPALIGRAFLLASWPVFLTTWYKPYTPFSKGWLSLSDIDTVTCASPLGILKESDSIAQGMQKIFMSYSNMDLFLGNIPGCLGETSALAILLGAIYLFYKKHITWHIPIPYIATALILVKLFDGDVLFHMLAGGLMLGAFFMMTDMVTSPVTKKGRIIFGVGGGILVFLIRYFGGYPEGVCYSILIMNAATPLIDRYTRPTQFGGK